MTQDINIINELKDGLVIEWQRDTIGGCEWLHSMSYDGSQIILDSGYWHDGNDIKHEHKELTEKQALEFINKNRRYELQRHKK